MNENNNDGGEFEDFINIRRQIVCDDPALTKLTVISRGVLWRSEYGAYRPLYSAADGYYCPFDDDWEDDGNRFGNNSRIEELVIEDHFRSIADDDLQAFLSGVARNRSIRKLSIDGPNLNRGADVLPTLIPFFKYNQKFECLEVSPDYHLDSSGVQNIASALAEFRSLKEFYLCEPGHGNADLSDVLQALTGHADLRKLVLKYVDLRRSGYASLATLLQNQASKLDTLELHRPVMNNETADILADGLSGNRALKKIAFSPVGGITEVGWMIVFDALQSRKCKLSELDLSDNRFHPTRGKNFRNKAAILLANFLTSHKSLRSLDFSHTKQMTAAGWGDLIAALQRPNSALEKLNLSSNSFDDQVALSFANSPTRNNKLKELDLSWNDRITSIGWEASLAVLLHPNSALEKLNLSSNSIDDDAAISLANALLSNCKLRELDLSSTNMTAAGLEPFSAVLQNPSSSLEKLNLANGSINDDAVISLAASLAANNGKLKELILADRRSDVTDTGWAAVSHILCDRTSIMSTYRSNHTLQKLSSRDRAVPEDVRFLLRLNREKKSRAARAKIIQTHFGGGFAVQPFLDMDVQVLPHAISWMGRDGVSHKLNERHYGFLKSMSSLFDINGTKKKRKREH